MATHDRIRLIGLLRKPLQMQGFLFGRASPVHHAVRIDRGSGPRSEGNRRLDTLAGAEFRGKCVREAASPERRLLTRESGGHCSASSIDPFTMHSFRQWSQPMATVLAC